VNNSAGGFSQKTEINHKTCTILIAVQGNMLCDEAAESKSHYATKKLLPARTDNGGIIF